MYTKVVNWSEEEAKEFNGEDVVEWTWCGYNWTPICKKKKKKRKKWAQQSILWILSIMQSAKL